MQQLKVNVLQAQQHVSCPPVDHETSSGMLGMAYVNTYCKW